MTLQDALHKVRNQKNAGLEHVRKPALMLIAIESMLAEKSTEPPSAEKYLVTLVTMLFETQHSQTQEATGVILYLLSTVIEFVDASKLRGIALANSAAFLEVLLSMQGNVVSSAPGFKSLITILECVLKSFKDKDLKIEKSAVAFACLLNAVVDARPKVRRQAQDAVVSVLTESHNVSDEHPYIERTCTKVLTELRHFIKSARQNKKQHGNVNPQDGSLIALLTFVKKMGTAWPESHDAELIPHVLSCLAFSSTYLSLAAMSLVSHLFSASHAATPALVQSTVDALLEAQPASSALSSETGQTFFAGWLDCLADALVVLARTNADVALKQASALFDQVLAYLPEASSDKLCESVETALVVFERYCLSDDDIRENGVSARIGASLNKALRSPAFGGYALPFVLHVVAAYISRLRISVDGKPAATYLAQDLVKTVAALRENAAFQWAPHADNVIATATTVCGPRWVLSLIPFEQDVDAHSWLLPVFRTSITNTELAHFRSYFLPLATTFNARSDQDPLWHVLAMQVVALFPGYCEIPRDTADVVDNAFLSEIANLLYTEPQARPPLFAGLARLVASSVQLAKSSAPRETLEVQFGVDQRGAQASVATLSSFAKDILAVGFNVYGQTQRGEGAYILNTLAEWIGLLDDAALNESYAGLIAAIRASVNNKQQLHALLDILSTMVPYLKGGSRDVFQFVQDSQFLQSDDTAVQKKSYRILRHLVESVPVLYEPVMKYLVSARDNIASGARAERLGLFSTLVDRFSSKDLLLVPALLPEVVLATKEVNEGTRNAAFQLVVNIGEKMAQGGTFTRGTELVTASLDEYIVMLSAGLVGSDAHMISATMTALGRAVFEFHAALPAQTLRNILHTFVIFLENKNREIIRADIGFIKIAVVVYAPEDLREELPQLVPGLFRWSKEHANHLKLRVRHIIERLLRKVGWDDVAQFVPEDDQKLLTNIRKRQQQSKKKKKTDPAQELQGQELVPKKNQSAYEEALNASDSEDSGSESDAAPTAAERLAASGPKGKRNARLRLAEDGELDLLDDSALATSAGPPPSTKTHKSPSSYFESVDGKIKVEESDSSAGSSVDDDDDDVDMGQLVHDASNAADAIQRRSGTGKFKRERDDDMDLDEHSAAPKPKKASKSRAIGQEFKAKRAGGDVKRNGVQPYAFVPMGHVAGKHSRDMVHVAGKKKRN